MKFTVVQVGIDLISQYQTRGWKRTVTLCELSRRVLSNQESYFHKFSLQKLIDLLQKTKAAVLRFLLRHNNFNLIMLNFQKCQETVHYQGGPRTGFSFTFVRVINSYLLFGGAINDNEVHIYNIERGSWSQQPTIGFPKKPQSRKYHAAAFIESIACLLINGGEDDSGRCPQDFYLLSVKDWKWRKVIVVKCPHPRARHCLHARSERQLVMFGGVSQYKENTNDIWIIKAQSQREGRQEAPSLECIKVQPKGPSLPQYRFVTESTYFCGDKLYAAGSEIKGDKLIFFCFDFKIGEWRDLDFSYRGLQARLFRVGRPKSEGFAAIVTVDQHRNSQSRLFLYDPNNEGFLSVKEQGDLLSKCQQLAGGNQPQILCARQGKRLVTVQYQLRQKQQQQGSIEQYSIAIKQEQLLSQQLTRKNALLEQLYREMQNYITQLHKQYVRQEEDSVVEAERQRHIEDCHRLKKQYAKFDRMYEAANEQIRAVRSDLAQVNQEFERCMETEFDEQA